MHAPCSTDQSKSIQIFSPGKQKPLQLPEQPAVSVDTPAQENSIQALAKDLDVPTSVIETFVGVQDHATVCVDTSSKHTKAVIEPAHTPEQQFELVLTKH